jgi:hypothetical protein
MIWLSLLCWTWSDCARASERVAESAIQPAEPIQAGPYRTPLAGEAGKESLFGYQFEIPPIDRGHMTSITLGASLLHPKQGETNLEPFAALWLRRVWDDARTRDLVSIFANELEYDRSWGPFELVGHFENYTIPGARTELVLNREIKSTAVEWGTLLGSLGPGLRIPVAPFQVDNVLRVQLLGRAGYFYAGRTDETGAGLVLPPDTLLYGSKLRVRYDNMRRNLLELPHSGFATGFDIDYLCRDRWRPLPGTELSSANRDFLQVSGYFVGAAGVPGLSERNRVLASLHGGTTKAGRGDRYNAFRINGGPFPSEEDDVARQHYTGAIYDDILATRYAVASAGYRREISFFLYLTLLGSYLWADRATALDTGEILFKETTSFAGTASLDCAFFWKSAFYLAYVWDSGVVRGGRSGSSVVINWNKLF